MPAFPVIRSMRRTVLFHLGSIALGSFVIAIIQFVRLVLNWLDKKTRKIQQESKVGWVGGWWPLLVQSCEWDGCGKMYRKHKSHLDQNPNRPRPPRG
jgi:choline transporter-like protein 2/4/5